jgi:ElaB/YqjD/DUF883 family membrane-anchored ribosome-binding protein
LPAGVQPPWNRAPGCAFESQAELHRPGWRACALPVCDASVAAESKEPFMAEHTRNEEADMADVNKDVAALRKDVDKLMSDLSQIAGDEVDRGVKKTRQAATKARDEVANADDALRETIRENPLAACGTALGAGVIGALMLRR